MIDEFHHAAAASYRRVGTTLSPAFLLGLTATPDRADGADLLSLCEDNLVSSAISRKASGVACSPCFTTWGT